MTPAGKIIDIDAFKKKESGLNWPKSAFNLRAAKRPRFTAGAKEALALVAAVIVALTYLMTPPGKEEVRALPAGSIAPENVKAPEELLVEDVESTEANRQAARDAALDVYDLDSAAAVSTAERLRAALLAADEGYRAATGAAYDEVIADMDRAVSSGAPATGPARLIEARRKVTAFEASPAFAAVEQRFMAALPFSLDAAGAAVTLRHYHYWPRIADLTGAALAPSMGRGVVARKADLPPSSARGIVTRELASGAERPIKSLAAIYDMAELERRVRDDAAAATPAGKPELRGLVTALALGMARPNLTFSLLGAEQARENAAHAVRPVFFKVQRGEMIVREGERVTRSQALKLAHLAAHEERGGRLEAILGTALFNMILVVLAVMFLARYHADIRADRKLWRLLALLLAAHMALLWASVLLVNQFTAQPLETPLETYLLAAPLAFGPMIVSIFFTTGLTVLFTIVVAALTAVAMAGAPIIALVTVTGGMMCAYHIRYYSKRSSVLVMGLIVAGVNLAVGAALGMAGAREFGGEQMYAALFAFAGGGVTALLVSGALPVIEGLFPVVSDIKLLELTSLNHPLLRRMIMEAPGTYHHSVMVGNLAEEACKAIGANALLARAGSLFHDIGKMNKPDYFVENQRHGQNPHDKLAPSMSALIVSKHIKDGLELARQHKLLPQIAAMIPEHHGTQTMKVFLHKAKTAAEKTRDDVSEEGFRYPGPIPSSRESACVAMADSIEAAARACPNPTPQRLKELVTGVINDKFIQGQLDNSHLTLHEIAVITESFTQTLAGMHHHRLVYPEPAKPAAPHADPHSQPPPDADASRA